MKQVAIKYFFQTIFLLFSFISYAQFSGEKIELPLIQSDKIWYCHNLSTKEDVIYKITNDTVINNMLFYKVFRKPGNLEQEEFYCFVTTAFKKYLLSITEKGDTIVHYQFPISLNDTIVFCWKVVGIEKLKLYNDHFVNKYLLKGPSLLDKSVWIEGIGDLEGLFYNRGKYRTDTCLDDVIASWFFGSGYERLDSVYLDGKLLFKISMLEELDEEFK